MKIRDLNFAFTLCFLVLGLQMVVPGQKQPDELAKLKISIQVQGESFGNIVSHLVNEYGISFGFEESELDRDHDDFRFNVLYPDRTTTGPTAIGGGHSITVNSQAVYRARDHAISLDFKDALLGDVMDELVSQMKHYTWRFENGVVNIFPIKGRDERIERALKLRIKIFKVAATEESRIVKYRVLRLPELTQFCASEKLKIRQVRDFGASYDALRLQFGRDLNASNLTLRELLNEIVKKRGGGWIISIRGVSPKQPGLLIIEI